MSEPVIGYVAQLTTTAANPIGGQAALEAAQAPFKELQELREEVKRLQASEKSAWNAAVTRDEEARRLRAALDSLHSVLRERHYGRMPDEVQKAFDAAGVALGNPA